MPHFQRVGELPRRRHTQFRRPDGQLYFEELIGEEGFVGDSALLYHRNSPSDVLDVAAVELEPPRFADNHPMQPRHIRTSSLKSSGDVVTSRVTLLGNEDVVISYVSADTASPLYRNAVGDELVFIHEGDAELQSVFGTLRVGRGDYVVIPHGIIHRWDVVGDTPFKAVIAEATGHIAPPSRYQSARGQLLESAPYCELDIRTPEGPLHEEGEAVDVLYKLRTGVTRYTMATHPFDVVGWFGCMYPWALNIWDFSPVTGSLHRPPPFHQTFDGPGFVVCSFVPRPFDFDPDAVPVPYYHSNVDSDEVLFYTDGDFMSRRGSGIERGSISLHPAGFLHGPHPGSREASLLADRTKETAMMIDTFRPLRLAQAALDAEVPGYTASWRES